MIEVLQDLDGALVLAPTGELCPLTAPALASCIEGSIEVGQRHLVIDLADVTLLTAAGVNVIALGVRLAAASGGTLTIRNATGLNARVLAITGFDRFVDPAADASAVARWN